MRTFIWAIVTASAGLLTSSIGQVVPSATGPAGTASLDARVTVMRDGQATPVRRAKVTLQSAAGATLTADTDANGLVRFKGIQGGQFKVIVDKPGFVPAGRVPLVQIRDGQAEHVAIGMRRGGAIAGRLQTADGEPAMRFIVSAVRLGYGPYGKSPVSIRQTTTDDLGRFRLHTLEPGEYYIEAAPDAMANMNTPVIPGNPPKPAKTYYAGTPRLSEAGVVVVGPEQEVSNISFLLSSAVTATVSGSVASSSGQLPTKYSIRLQRLGGPPSDIRCFLNSGGPTDRSFSCRNAPPGDYWLLATARLGANAEIEFSASRINVEGQDFDGLALRTAAGASIRGRVEVDGGAPLPAGIQVAALETEYEFPNVDNVAGAAIMPASLEADGTFAFGSLAGARILRLSRAPEGWAIKSVLLDGVDITDQPTSFTPSEPRPMLRVVVTAQTGSVMGAVRTEDGQLAAGAQVVIFATDNRRWGARSRFIRMAEVSPSGQYAVRGLLPGEYCVAFADDLPSGAWEDPDVLMRLGLNAPRITVTASNSVTVNGRVK